MSSAASPHVPAADHDEVRRILQRLGLDDLVPHTASDRIDRVVLHPVLGPLLLALLLFVVFQAVFAGAERPMAWIEAGTAALGDAVAGRAGAGAGCAACWWTASSPAPAACWSSCRRS